jgi:hypothetical protein
MATEKQDELDRILDAALQKYLATEPREGLEGRVLANLRSARGVVTDHVWWRRSVMAAVATIIVVALALVWRSDQQSHPTVATHPSSAQSEPKENPQTVANGGKEVHPQKRSARPSTHVHKSRPDFAIAASPKPGSPKLEEFPSPHPLSAQEKILVNYVTQYPQHAALIAQARTEALHRDKTEEMRAAAGNEQDSQQQNSQREAR